MEILDAVIEFGSPFVMGILYKLTHMVSGLKRPKLEVKPFPKLLKALFLKARESALVHQRDEVHELSIMLSHCEVGLYGISYIELIWFGLIVATHNVDELFG